MSSESAPPDVIDVGDGFWNIRGSFKIGKLIEIGTHASLVRRASGKYVFLDACSLSDATRRWVSEITNGGDDIEAVIHLHPFHTVFVRGFHELFPKATLYGTARHHEKASDLPWATLRSEEPALHELFADDLDFSVPRGVDFISSNEKLHFSSVLAFHRASKTLHVDDTVTYVRLPGLLQALKKDVTTLHPTLPKVLEPRAGAAADFRDWTRELVTRCRDVDNLCAAHTATLLGRENTGASVAERVQGAIDKAESKVAAHERKYG